MDALNHAALGAMIGVAATGNCPYSAESAVLVVGCTIASVAPDSPLFFIKGRVKYPPKSYLAFHSIWPLIPAAAISPWVALAWLSHILIDIPTHGPTWAVRPLYPLKWSFNIFDEWEFGNPSWIRGLVLTYLMGITCLLTLPTFN